MGDSSPTPRLPVEVVPDSLRGLGFKEILRDTSYRTILRNGLMRRHNDRCAACGDDARSMICQDVWGYERKGSQDIQRLVGFRLVCHSCYMVICMPGNQTVVGWLKRTQERLCKYNGWSQTRAWAYMSIRLQQYQELNSRNWTQDITPFKDIYAELTDRTPDMGSMQARLKGLTAAQGSEEAIESSGQRFLDIIAGPFDLETGLQYLLYAIASRHIAL